jgi:hypothetical protein
MKKARPCEGRAFRTEEGSEGETARAALLPELEVALGDDRLVRAEAGEERLHPGHVGLVGRTDLDEGAEAVTRSRAIVKPSAWKSVRLFLKVAQAS